MGIWLISLFSVYNGNDELNNLIEKRKTMTYHQYFDKYLFASVKEELENFQKDYGNVLCIGFEPNIAQFNGIKTLDSYQNNYRLDFKNAFYKIIQNELKKDSAINRYFTEFGSRCYSFSSELNYKFIYTKHDTINIKNLNYNFEQAKNMNANYLLSAVEILNNTKLQFIKKFETVKSYRKIYLYKIL
jgi:hypothetical protein